MALCVITDANGALVGTATAPAQCTGYIVESASDYLAHSIFTIPDASALHAAWAAGFLVPMSVGLVAWAIGELVNFWND